MLNSLFQAICRVGIFMICAQALIHFRAQETYEKYLKILVSIMILIQLFLPVGAFIMGGDRAETEEALKQFRREMEESVNAAEENAAAADAILEQMTLEEVRKRMEAQEEEMAEEAEGQTRQEDREGQEGKPEQHSEESGAAENMGEAEHEKIGVKAVEPVSIGTVSVGEETDDR